jgi:epsilon-lactone hydrolase
VSRQSWQARRTADILRVSAKVSLHAAARTRTDTGRALLVIRRMAESAAPLFKRLPPHAQVVPADCDGVSGEWVRTGTGLDESKVVLLFHGGYYSLSAAAVRPLTWRLSEAARRPVLAIDYALAPENDLPAARADALTTYRWLLADGFRPEDVTLAGDSTGGHLALATVLAVGRPHARRASAPRQCRHPTRCSRPGSCLGSPGATPARAIRATRSSHR